MENDWLLLIAQLPTEDPASRMRVMRTLEALGAAVLRDGVYVLPHTASNRQALDALAEYVGRGTGGGQVLQAQAVTPAQQETLARLFDRSARYDALMKTVDSLRVSFGHSDPSAISRVLHKQRREFELISALDFFPDGTQARAHKALADAEADVRKLVFSGQEKAALDPTRKLLGRTWATRKPLGADRLACAWLIRRFIDPEATLRWLDKGDSVPHEAIGFGYDGAPFSNNESRVTFEEMLARLDLGRNAALGKMAAIVHALELHGSPVPEAAGVQTLLQGAIRRATNESELLLEAEKTFELLYEAYG